MEKKEAIIGYSSVIKSLAVIYIISLYLSFKAIHNLLNIQDLVTRIKEVYPGWILRIYHDKSIIASKKCEIECMTDPAGNYYDNADFCDVEDIPRIPDKGTIHSSMNVRQVFSTSWNASYIHSSMWRYIAIGDLFVEAFVSRVLDMELYRREVEAVNEWLSSNLAGHIMRGLKK